MSETIGTLLEYWKLIAFGAGLLCVLYVTIKDVKTLKGAQKEFVTKGECGQLHSMLCRKIEEVQKKLHEMDKERMSARTDWEKELRDIREFIGRVDQFMQDAKNGGFK